MTKAVPAGATVVGIPGRIVRRAEEDASEEQRRQMADKVGFDAYGVTNEVSDPVAHAIGCMLDHLQAMDKRMDKMGSVLCELRPEYCDEQLPELKKEDFEGAVEEDLKSS